MSESEIAAVEQQLGIRFPASYKEAVLACHGGSPLRGTFDVPDEEIGLITTGLGMLLTFNEDDAESVVDTHRVLADRLPASVIPFAIEGGSDYIAFDYRSGNEPAVVYWSHEKEAADAITRLARNFDEFTALLRDE
ncbi:MAG: SMI1/KNR4 family protein [Acidobacteria bacterium]|nr:SMI1/KNR4 family protein [Acidobacteriota bacterium]MBV9186890.1 SMI1/KNR4 family protein [Acidobacteriota bacterium]